jgi:hypothetical protein
MGVSMDFQESKQGKLNRLPWLRIMHYIGMIGWREDKYGEAIQHIRLLHPLSWIYALLITIVSVLMQGVPETIRELKQLETVWW